MQFDRCRTDLDLLIGPQSRAFLDGNSVHERAIAGAEILDESVVEVDREHCVPARNEFRLKPQFALRAAPHDIIARPEHSPQQFRAIRPGYDYFGLWRLHRVRV